MPSQEIWKTISWATKRKGSNPNQTEYEISNFGGVRRTRNSGNGKPAGEVEPIIMDGCRFVNIYKTRVPVARLVYLTFAEDGDQLSRKEMIAHKDGDTENNYICNLFRKQITISIPSVDISPDRLNEHDKAVLDAIARVVCDVFMIEPSLLTSRCRKMTKTMALKAMAIIWSSFCNGDKERYKHKTDVLYALAAYSQVGRASLRNHIKSGDGLYETNFEFKKSVDFCVDIFENGYELTNEDKIWLVVEKEKREKRISNPYLYYTVKGKVNRKKEGEPYKVRRIMKLRELTFMEKKFIDTPQEVKDRVMEMFESEYSTGWIANKLDLVPGLTDFIINQHFKAQDEKNNYTDRSLAKMDKESAKPRRNKTKEQKLANQIRVTKNALASLSSIKSI